MKKHPITKIGFIKDFDNDDKKYNKMEFIVYFTLEV
jgi:hypothetical protein